jgi:DNA-directed RNA polymerase specialized sigma24 family protein
MRAREPWRDDGAAPADAVDEEDPREDAIARLLRRRSALDAGEVVLFKKIFPDLMEQHFDTVWGVLRGKGLGEADANDLLQETFARFFERTCKEGFPDSIEAKLCASAAGMALNLRRDAAREVPGLPSSGAEPAASIPSLASLLDDHALRRRVMLALSPTQMEAVEAVYLRRLSHAEAARELGIRRTTLTSRLGVAREIIVALANAFNPPDQP